MTDKVAEKDSRRRRHRRWSRRTNRFGIRNGRFVLLLIIAAVAGIGAVFLTAYMGLR